VGYRGTAGGRKNTDLKEGTAINGVAPHGRCARRPFGENGRVIQYNEGVKIKKKRIKASTYQRKRTPGFLGSPEKGGVSC